MSIKQHPLKKLLDEHGILQKDLPERLRKISGGKVKITAAAVSNWLAGRNSITVGTRPYLAKLFDVPEETFAPSRPGADSRGGGTAVLGETVKSNVAPLEIDLTVRTAMTPGEPPLYRSRYLSQVEVVDGKEVLIAREREGRDPNNLIIEVGSALIEGMAIADRVDSVNFGAVEGLLAAGTDSEPDPVTTLIIRVPLRSSVLQRWLGPTSR